MKTLCASVGAGPSRSSSLNKKRLGRHVARRSNPAFSRLFRLALGESRALRALVRRRAPGRTDQTTHTATIRGTHPR